METKRFRAGKKKRLNAAQSYVEYPMDDRRIHLFHTVYRIIADAYDERAEIDKDVWDMRKLGLSLNLSKSKYLLNFELIAQPWLRHLAKEFMKYSMAIRSTEDCSVRLSVLRDFSRFLTHYFPQCRTSDLDRTIILKYLGVLREQKALITQLRYLSVLRTFLETCAYRLHMPELTREPLIFEDDFAKVPLSLSREIPEEVQVQLREHLDSLPTTTLRMVTILLECGLRLHELCSLSLDCLIHDDKHEWYLCFYQTKSHKDHIIPLVNEKVIGTIQAQQQEIREQRGNTCPYLFPSARFPQRPYRQSSFTDHLNQWAVKHDIQDHMGRLYRFTSHQFRHTLSMRLIDEDVPLEVISRLLGHSSLIMTQVYARVRDKKMRAVLERVNRQRKTVDAQGQVVKGDPRANDPDAQMTRKGIRGQTLPVGGCGRLVVLGECSHANKCLTCPMWLTSTDDVSKLKSFYERAVRLKQRAEEKGNHFVVDQQEHIIASLAIRIKSLEATEMDGTLAVDEVGGSMTGTSPVTTISRRVGSHVVVLRGDRVVTEGA